MQGDKISPCQQFIQLNLLDAAALCIFRRKIWVEANDPHFQPLGPVGDNRANIAAADDAKHLAGDLDSHEF